MLRLLVQSRKRLGAGPLGRVARKLGLRRPLLALYERSLGALTRSGRTIPLDVLGRTVRFHAADRAEASVLIDHWEMDHVRFLCERFRAGDVFYDVGANVGLFACSVGAVRRGEVAIHAFEPLPANARRLEDNAKLNGLAHMKVHEVAFSDRRGQLEFFTQGGTGTPTSSLFAHHWSMGEARRAITVEVWPPIEYAREHELPPPTVVKCDVEGAEGGVLRGMRPWLEAGTIRLLLVEYHPGTLAEQGESAEAIDAMVRGCGYRALERLDRGGASRPAYEIVYERDGDWRAHEPSRRRAAQGRRI